MTITKFLDPKNDVAFRRIFGSEKNKDILMHFINDVLELKNNDKVQEITFLPTIAVPEIAAKKQSAVDVLCKGPVLRTRPFGTSGLKIVSIMKCRKA